MIWMKNIMPYLLFCIGVLTDNISIAQNKSSVKFGKISVEDLQQKVYSIDSNANAVIIADIGTSEILAEGSWFRIIHKRFKRIHILKSAAYNLANIAIPVFTNQRGDDNLESVKASTYNLENGKIVESKLDLKNSVYTDKLIRGINLKKFSLPNVKEGSIIEFEYSVFYNSLFNFPSWEFQGANPVLWSEYTASIPEFSYYLILPQGNQQYFIKEKKDLSQGYILRGSFSYYSERAAFSATVTENHWVMKDVPSLKEENFTSTISNHISKIDFMLSAFRYPLIDRNVLLNWNEIMESFLKDEEIGLQLKRDNTFLKDVVDSATRNSKTETEKARSIFCYVRDNFTCNSHNQFLPNNDIKDLFKNRKGSVATINFLLIAMLKRAGISADPVILSTRSNGYPPVIYPLVTRLNYLVCKTTLDGNRVFLDASYPLLGFGKLDWQCYNGLGRTIDAKATGVELQPDSVIELSTVSIVLAKEGKDELAGYCKKNPGYYESYRIRKEIKEKGKEDYFKLMNNKFGADVDVSNNSVESLSDYDDNLSLSFDMKLKTSGTDVLYINPMFTEGKKENPFKSSSRLYPVEMPYTTDEAYILRMEIPEGYQLEELPKSIRLNYDDEGRSFFEYIISEKNGTIMLRSRIKLSRTYFLPDEYEVLREFFAQVVNKHNEQIVLKKKK